ncbi:TIGR04063 family PEP-CTERM/XrtA system glycosyltransferase [Altererythrobacter sp.]|uniref:TIGR04063 family PEP-CTERM/XrtA system glycosyltransferase n=1 Tax=Altererythrobacter sp. TaxID=1872480 RepID=UPI003D02AB0E
MTRVLHVLDHSLPLHSGYTFRTRAILKAQQAAGIEVRGVTGLRHSAEGPVAETVDGLLFHRSPGSAEGPAVIREWREIAQFAAGIEAVVADWRPDIIHAHSPAICGEAAMRVARKHGIPLVYEIRAFWEDAAVGNGNGREGSVKYRLTRALENRVVEGADAVFTICHGLRDDLVSRGFAPGKIGISPNGVDLSLFGEPVPRDDTLAKKLGITEGEPVIGFIGSFYDYEGLDDLIAAMPLLREDHPGAKLLLTGGGPMEEALRAQLERLPDPGCAIFTGRVPHSEVERYYSLIDILAYPRKRSRLTDLVTPLKPLEAMAQQRLVAASDVGGHCELVSDDVTGTLFPADDPAGCADALSRLLDARNDWDAMKARAAAHVREHHDWATNIQRYQLVYHDLLERRNESRAARAA